MNFARPHRVILAAACIVAVSPAAAAEIRALPVPVATIYPGQIVSPDNLTDRQFRVTAQSLAGIAISADDIAGKQTRRRLLAGKPIPLQALSAPVLIKRGQSASASFDDQGVSISMTVQALEDGAADDLITVRVTDTGKVLRVKVNPDGTLALGGS